MTNTSDGALGRWVKVGESGFCKPVTGFLLIGKIEWRPVEIRHADAEIKVT